MTAGDPRAIYDEALSRYDEALNESERINQLQATAPSDENARAAAEAFDLAQQAYADLAAAHAAIDEAEAESDDAEAAPTGGFDYSEPDVLTALAVPTSDPDGPPLVILRRGTTVRLVEQPPSAESDDEGITVRRNLMGGSVEPRKSVLTRNRKIAGNLPEWSPMPPGEIQTPVKRRKS